VFELKASAVAQPQGGKLDSKINTPLFHIPFCQYGAFYKNITKWDETNKTCNKSTAVFCMQIVVNAPSTHVCSAFLIGPALKSPLITILLSARVICSCSLNKIVGTFHEQCWEYNLSFRFVKPINFSVFTS